MRKALKNWFGYMMKGALFLFLVSLMITVVMVIPVLLFTACGAIGKWWGAAYLLFIELPLITYMES